MKKRIVSLLMAVLMLVTMLPVAAMAEELTMTDPTEEQVVSGETTPDPSEEPETPEEPEEPDQPGEPEQPEQPEEPETPQEPEQPVENDPEEAAPDNENDIALFAGEGGSVTRIAWVQMLVSAFDMTVEEDNYPDNYYTDIDSTAAYYRDLMVAVEFGVIDLEAGLPFEPEEPATREFAAHTLNYCLGFQLDDSTYTYADTADVTYKDDVQVAVNRGWFVLVSGKFLPQQAMTSAEAAAMVADTKTVLAGDRIDAGHKNTFKYIDGVVEVPSTSSFQMNGEDLMDIEGLPASVTIGTIFVVYVDDFPQAYRALSVQRSGNKATVSVKKVSLDDILTSIDAQGSAEGDLTDFETADNVDISYIFSDGTETQSRALAKASQNGSFGGGGGGGGFRKRIDSINLHKKIGGYAITCQLSDLSANWSISARNLKTLSAMVVIDGKASISGTVPVSAPTSVELGYIPVGFLGSISVIADLSADGSITVNYACTFQAGYAYSSADGFRPIYNFSKDSFSIAADVNLTMGLKIRVGITNLPLVYGTCTASIGAKCNYTIVTHPEADLPNLCVGTDGWMYSNIDLAVGVRCTYLNFDKNWKKTITIWGRNNSPVRYITHFEDNIWVSSCTCDTTGVFGNYFTAQGSRYFNDGRSSVVNMPTYTYTIDNDNNATITSYSGNVSALSIPSTIDGYTVVAIGNGAFKGNVKLAAVTIPDTVTTIEEDAFSGCTGLTDINLPKNLKTLGEDAFYGCSGLTSVLIPKTVENIQSYYNGGYSPFRECNNLQIFRFEDGMTRIPNGILNSCAAKLDIVIPDSVTEIGNGAFRYSGLVTVTIPDTVTTIEEDAFSGCTGLTSVMVPNSVTDMGTGIFANCTSLTNVTLPNIRQNIGARTFEGCTSLEKIVLPETVMAIRDSAFKNCTALKEIVWSKAPELIEANAFYNCDALTEVEIPTTVTSVGDQAFYDCDSLTTVDFPDSVTKMGTKVFYDCDALTSVKLGSGITTIPVYTFEHCDVLESIVIPRRVTTIGNNAFKNCVKFTSITIPRSVTSISSNVFSYPAKMTIYGVAGTYAETFANANNIRFVDKQVNATAVTLSSKELTLSKGASATLFLTVTPEDFTDEVSWKSGNTSVVTVNDAGVIKAVGLGTATIKVMVGNVSASCKVTVQQLVTSISLNKTSLTLEALATYQLTATAYPNNAVDRRVNWSSSAPDIASVDDNGLVTAHKKGSATVTATAMDGSDVTKKCTVTVSNTAYICATVEAMESPHNYPNSCSDFWVYTIPGAEKLRVTFDARTDIEDGFDYLYVFDGTGKQVGKYTGTELAGQTITIPGDTVKLKLVSDGSGNEWGFKVSRISSGTASGTVAGNVTTGGNAADPVTIVFKQNGNTVKTATVSGGSYRVSGLTDGSYTLEASKPGCVPRSYTVTVMDGEVVNSPNVVLVATGNVNGVSVSGEDVEITDVACLYRYLTANDRSQSSIPDEAYFLAVADVNSDGAVDVYDLQLLYETVSGIAKT